MPNRIIKESICTSESLSELSWFEQSLFFRLIVLADDYGVCDARPAVVRGRAMPLHSVTDVQIANALNKMAMAGIIDLYNVGGKSYLQFSSWAQHQQIRAKKHKYPMPNERDSTCNQLISNDSNCTLESNPIQSESESNPSISVAPVIFIPLVGDATYGVSQDQVDEWAQLYPGVDIMQELRNMVGWSKANPSKRKTKRGVLRFITGWLEREQNSGRKRTQKGDGSVWQGLETL